MITSRPLPWSVMIVLWLIVIGLAITPILLIRDTEFGGADAAAEVAVVEINPDYEPWFNPLFEPPGSEIESLLFALQTGLGAGFIGFFFGWHHGRRRRPDR